jgi:hypothetical protein
MSNFNIGDSYGFNNRVNFFVYKINNYDTIKSRIEIIVVSKSKYTKIEKQKRLIFSYSFSIEQMNNFYNKSIVLIEKKPWRIG